MFTSGVEIKLLTQCLAGCSIYLSIYLSISIYLSFCLYIYIIYILLGPNEYVLPGDGEKSILRNVVFQIKVRKTDNVKSCDS
jgi:hypothetical protein